MRAFFRRIALWFKNLFFRDEGGGGDPGEYMDYYGCPNSKKAAKLQMSKKSYRYTSEKMKR